MSDNVLVSRADLQKVLDYLADNEYTHYLESVENGDNVENHIYTVVSGLIDCIQGQ